MNMSTIKQASLYKTLRTAVYYSVGGLGLHLFLKLHIETTKREIVMFMENDVGVIVIKGVG